MYWAWEATEIVASDRQHMSRLHNEGWLRIVFFVLGNEKRGRMAEKRRGTLAGWCRRFAKVTMPIYYGYRISVTNGKEMDQ